MICSTQSRLMLSTIDLLNFGSIGNSDIRNPILVKF